MTPEQKKKALAHACVNAFPSCIRARGCPICGVCMGLMHIMHITDEMACDLYAEAVKRGAIKEEQ